MRLRLGIRYLLLVANGLILLMPVFAVVFLHLWEGHLVRLTEQQLIAESVLVGETWRERLAEEGAPATGVAAGEAATRFEPQIELDEALQPPLPAAPRDVSPGFGPAWRAGARLLPLLRAAQRGNLSSARILDAEGCVVASVGDDLGECRDDLPEVRKALQGQYAALPRERRSDASGAALAGIRPRGGVEVFTATPVRGAERVLGVVLLSRVTDSPLGVFWRQRYTVLAAVLLCLAATAAVSLFLSRVISRPVVDITRAAEAIVRGEAPRSFRPSRLGPSEITALGEALDRMTRLLTDRAAYIAQFATNVSHELKTPLTGIRGAVELLREEWDGMSADQRLRFLGNIDADAARMERLVTRLLQLARIQSSPETAEPVEVAPFFRQMLGRYDGRVRLDVAAAPEIVVINPDHLETAVRNLVDNALHHGGDTPVEVGVSELDGRLAVTVHDRGPGISEGNRQRIFERFFTTDRDGGGTGLGLAIVRAVAETRGGRVDFESRPGETTFRLVV